jgi:hypothetical protein
MQYLGVEYGLVRAIQGGKWKWSVSMIGVGSKAGLENSRWAADGEAKKAIVWLLAKRRRESRSLAARISDV